ncbi:putative cytochrome P450 [Annulohypoxylon truncatum]|uniref:putative cytochrome P450 n=1 Tax=Annulohypoxylon truncatum TaxID=327061 RepID=UPI0020087724|nr:putative cytochrome P450 [Annulohypoxylon truncatum]KAI1212618.1 putative cytochrome P450 [Annulohypoxylon truncatum]
MAWLTILSAAGVMLCTTLVYLTQVVYNHRRKINELRKQGVPMPKEWSWITGHLTVLQKYVNGIPPDAAVAFAMRDLCQEYTDTEVFLMDFWPVYPPLFTIFGPGAISQVCNKYNLPKTKVAFRFMEPISGGPNLVTMNGEEWKYWRSLFNYGFSTGAMLNNVPHIVDSILVFREKLVERIGKGMFSLDELATKVTMEIILKVTLDDDSNYQRSPHVLATALGRVTAWHSFWDPRVLMHPFRPFVQKYNGYVMNTYIHKELEKRFQEIKESRYSDDYKGKPKSIKSVTTLAFEAYIAERQDTDALRVDKLDKTFADYVAYQIRTFVFAGTDSTASIMVYVYHMLAKHPDWLEKLRKEHDEIFGQEPADAAGILKENPSLLNSCKLTLAFIKETLRLYGPAGTLRSGAPGITITDLQGNQQPMEYAGANVLHQALHLNPRVWPRATEFLPERFLVGPEHELYPDPAAYRPFEQGPRNCIGQTLVWNELRIAVILTCRDLTIRDAYDDFDAKRESEMSIYERLKEKIFGKPIKTLYGDRAYQTDTGGLHPADGYPCYVEWAKDH